MRLRYLHVLDLPPLNDVEIVFGYEPLLARPLAVRFIVGVNGTGKTRLLQAMTETFLCLTRQRVPPFPITLAYDLGTDSDRRTIYLYRPKERPASEVVLIEYDAVLPESTRWDTSPEAPERNRFSGDALPGTGAMDAFLPTPLLAYTSGSTETWRALFAPQIRDLGQVLMEYGGGGNKEQERPIIWNAEQERNAYLLAALRLSQESTEEEPKDRLVTEQIRQAGQIQVPSPDELRTVFESASAALFVTTEQLKLATCAVTLYQAIQEWTTPSGQAPPNPDLRALLNEVKWEAPLSISMDIDFRLDRLLPPQAKTLHELITLATAVDREPEPGIGRNLVFDLAQTVSGESATVAEELFEVLGGEDPTPFQVFRTLYDWRQSGLLRDLAVVMRKSGAKDVLLYDWLSDGERMFLGRIALFYLLKGQDNAMLILDEPDTHFNDIWKRRIVDILDDALGDLASDVIISTHSSIALTDVFAEEIELLQIEDGTTVVGRVTMPTFGADPSEIMINVFGAPDSLGKRALEYLDAQLVRDWQPEERDELEYLIRHVGPGYHRSELRTIWRKLGAPQD
jgi:hypothetical protein